MGWDDGKRKRLEREAKAIQRKAQRQGGEIRGRDVSRLKKVTGRIIKNTFIEDEPNEYEHSEEW